MTFIYTVTGLASLYLLTLYIIYDIVDFGFKNHFDRPAGDKDELFFDRDPRIHSLIDKQLRRAFQKAARSSASFGGIPRFFVHRGSLLRVRRLVGHLGGAVLTDPAFYRHGDLFHSHGAGHTVPD